MASRADVRIVDRTIHLTCQVRPQGGFLVTASDVTSVLAAETRLVEQNIRFDAALGNMPHGLCMFDAGKKLLLLTKFQIAISSGAVFGGLLVDVQGPLFVVVYLGVMTLLGATIMAIRGGKKVAFSQD